MAGILEGTLFLLPIPVSDGLETDPARCMKEISYQYDPTADKCFDSGGNMVEQEPGGSTDQEPSSLGCGWCTCHAS